MSGSYGCEIDVRIRYKFRMHKKRPEIFLKFFDVTIDITSQRAILISSDETTKVTSESSISDF